MCWWLHFGINLSVPFPRWVSQLWSETCVSTLVTAVLFSSWPWVMYCFHYLPMYLGCSLCGVLILCCCLFCVSGFSPGVSGSHVERLHVFLLVCGLRKVKDPLYLVEAFSGTPIRFIHHLFYLTSNNHSHLARSVFKVVYTTKPFWLSCSLL